MLLSDKWQLACWPNTMLRSSTEVCKHLICTCASHSSDLNKRLHPVFFLILFLQLVTSMYPWQLHCLLSDESALIVQPTQVELERDFPRLCHWEINWSPGLDVWQAWGYHLVSFIACFSMARAVTADLAVNCGLDERPSIYACHAVQVYAYTRPTWTSQGTMCHSYQWNYKHHRLDAHTFECWSKLTFIVSIDMLRPSAWYPNITRP